MKNWTELLSIVFIFCLGFIAYSNTFHCSFHFDDNTFIVDNLFIKNISDLAGIWKYYPCRFVSFLSIALNYHFNQLDVFGYHLFNLGVHIVSACLVWWLVLLTLSTPAMNGNKITPHANIIALLAGLVFVSHPVQIESVTYIWQRAASMAAMFYLASLCFYIKSRLLRGKGIYYICSLITAILAMFTKETSLTLPLMVLIYEFYFFVGAASKPAPNINWRYLIPFLFAIFIIPLTTFLNNSESVPYIHGSPGLPGGITPVQYALTQFRVMVTYIRLVFIPINQNFDYDYLISKSIFELPTLFSFLFLIAILFSAIYLYPKYRLISFSILWFFINFLPESIPFPVKDVICEHRLYLPLVGYSMFLVSSIYYLLLRRDAINGVSATMLIVLIGIIICNSFLAYQRNKVWKNDITLWNDTIGKSPHNARAYLNRGRAYIKQGNLDQAMIDLNKSIDMYPHYSEAYYDRGVIYEIQGKLILSFIEYSKAIINNPNLAIVYYRRGVIYKKLGQFSRSISDFNKSILLNPNFADAFNDRSIACSLLKKRDSASQRSKK